MSRLFILVSFLLISCTVRAACPPNQGQWTINTNSAVFQVCPSDGSNWVTVGNSTTPGIPSGMIALFNATCPTGWTELTAARGRVVVGVPASGTLAGTVGTALTDLQDKSVTPTFSGSALGTHTHTVTATGTNAASATTGNCAATNLAIGTGATTACKATAPNLTVAAQTFTGSSATSSAVTGGTPAGTVSAVATSNVIATIQYRYCSKD